MRRVVSVWLLAWPITRLTRAEPEWASSPKPLALVESGAHGLTVTAVNEAAERAGVLVGAALANARAALPTLISRPAEPRKDRAALLRLARWAGRYGPNRNIDGDDGLWIDVSGVAHLFSGEEAMLDDLMRRLSGFGVKAQAGLADTLGAAHALARFACGGDAAWGIAKSGKVRAALAQLPVEGLRLEAQSVVLLKRLGLRRIGQLYDIPRASLERRFPSIDAAGAVLKRLDQALGLAEEPCRALAEPPDLFAARNFPEPLISSEALEAVAAELSSELAGLLHAKGLAVRAVRLMIYRADGTTGAVSAVMSAPCRDSRHFMTLIAEKIAGFDAGFGVDLMRFEALRAIRNLGSQKSLAATAAPAADPAPLVDRLVNRLGDSAVTMLEFNESHVPERAEVRLPALQVLSASRPAFSYAPPWPYGTAHGPKRPAFLLARPEPISVIAEIPDGPPARFVWRRVEHRVARAEGPERIAPEWHRALHIENEAKRPRTRDYYAIEDEEGAGYWVFRHGLYGGGGVEDSPSWFLHGLFA